MSKHSTLLFAVWPTLLLAGCAMTPTGPSVMALPGTGKTYEQFRADDAICQQAAFYVLNGVTPQQSAAQSGVASAAVGTAIGSAAGAAIGGGQGAAVGAGMGLLAGSAVGVGAAESAGYGAQTRYDAGYIQCMYAKGHRVPVWGRFTGQASATAQPSQGAYTPPPPPPGQPPPVNTLP